MAKISVVVPVFQNSETLPTLILRLTEVIGRIEANNNYELVLVDDGSTDNSFTTLLELSAKYPCAFKILRLSRNFGQVAAISAGLTCSSGDAVVIMSADLQDPPEIIPRMIEEWSRGQDLVIAHRASRQDSIISQITSRIAYRIARNKYPSLPRGGFDFLLLSARAKDAYLGMKGKNRFFQGDIMYLGYSVAFVPYARAQRASGKSQWTFVKRLKYFQDMIVASSDLIPRSATIIGAVLSILGVATSSLLLIRLLSKESAYSDSLPEVGISLLMVIAGLIIFLLGQIGEYLWRIHEEIVDRPIFLVDQMVEKPSE